MQAEDAETVRLFQAHDGERRVEWGHWGIRFCRGTRSVGTLYFGAGAAGPADGCHGSTERERYLETARAWVAAGTLPEGLSHPEAS